MIAQITEQQQHDGDIEVGYTHLCRDANDEQLQGFIRVGSAISRNNEGGEGYHVMFVRKWFRASDASAPPDVKTTKTSPTQPPNVVEPVGGVASRMSRVQVDGATTLVVNMNVRVAELASGAMPEIRSVTSTRNGERKSLNFEVRNGQLSIKSVPILGTEKVEAHLASGKIILLPIHGIGLTSVGQAHLTDWRVASDQSTAWRIVSTALGVTRALNAGDLSRLSVARSVRVETSPAYGPLKGGKVALEDSSPWSQEVNRVISRGTRQQIERMFGAPAPIKAEWAFTAFDVNTDKSVPVVLSPAKDPAAIQIALIEGTGGKSGFVATFPDREGSVFELIATVSMRDGLGGNAKAAYRLSSHAIEVANKADIESLIRTLARLADVPADVLARASQLSQPERSYTIPRLYIFRRAIRRCAGLGWCEYLPRMLRKTAVFLLASLIRF